MLNIEIHLYASDDVGGKYNTALLSHEDDAVKLAVEVFESEQFQILWRCLDYISETVSYKIHNSTFLTKEYYSEVFGRIFKRFKQNPEKYERYLEYLVKDELSMKQDIYSKFQKELKNKHELSEESIQFYLDHINRLANEIAEFNLTKNDVEKELLERYEVKYVLI